MPLSETDLILEPLDCKSGGREPICVMEPDDECCKGVPREVIPFENGEVIRHGNSAVVSLKIAINDPVEQFIFDRIRTELARNSDRHLTVMKNPEEGFEISFFLSPEMVKTRQERQQLIKYWFEFARNLRSVLTDGKMVFNKYVRSRAANVQFK
ncbi:MAG: hypothetical protein ACFFFG_18865 [Candidatus Thorarchaeota archaeon]